MFKVGTADQFLVAEHNCISLEEGLVYITWKYRSGSDVKFLVDEKVLLSEDISKTEDVIQAFTRA